MPVSSRLLADTACDADHFRAFLTERGTLYKGRNVIGPAFSHLKDWRRVATPYDKLAKNFRSTILLAAILIWWT